MRPNPRFTPAFACLLGTGLLAANLALAPDEKTPTHDNKTPAHDSKKPAADAPAMPLPPGWTAEDMATMMACATPGKMQAWLSSRAGAWTCKQQMWMPGSADPMSFDGTYTITPMLGGRYIQSDYHADMPGMGPFSGLSITGFDNASQHFVGFWIDSMSTGFMTGTGELSPDGKTLTWNFTYNDPITKKPAPVRQIETFPDANSMTMEMWMTDPKTQKQYKLMTLDCKRKM